MKLSYNIGMKKIFVVFFLTILVLSVIPVQGEAQGLVQCGGCEEYDYSTGACLVEQPACGFCDIFILINNIIRFFLVPTTINGGFAVVPLLATLFFVIGGFFLLTSGGSPERQTKGRNILLATVVGLVIVYGSWIFLTLIFSTFTNVDWSTLQIQCRV